MIAAQQLAGIALARANQTLRGGSQNGILYAIEAQDLNLEGTELVVLSPPLTLLSGDYSCDVLGRDSTGGTPEAHENTEKPMKSIVPV